LTDNPLLCIGFRRAVTCFLAKEHNSAFGAKMNVTLDWKQ
jgi:hypothetical protein